MINKNKNILPLQTSIDNVFDKWNKTHTDK